MSQPEYQGNQKKQTDSSGLFSEVLYSGREIEGLFEMKRREEMQANGAKRSSSKKKGKNGLKDPLGILKERVEIYNKKKEDEFHLSIEEEEDLSYGGLLTFSYHNGYQTLCERFQLTNSNTAGDIVLTLLRAFLPQYDMNESNSSSYIMLSQGGSERELETLEKPLEIALDCSTRGLSPPSFFLKTSVSLLLTSTSPQKRFDGKLSSLSLQASSLSSLGHTSSDSESPQVGSPRVMYEDHDSLYSFSSTSSIPSSVYPSNGSRSPRSLFKSQSRSKARSKSAQKLSFENSFHKMSEPILSISPVQQQLTPELYRKGGNKSKSKVGNFMEGVARSLKSKKKIRPPSIYPEDCSLDPRKSALISPKLAQKHFSMPTVFHIYYSKAKNMQLYKSVLVLESSTAQDVIKQSLERYGMKFMSPESFSLFEVIGKWEEIAVEYEPAYERSLVLPPSDQSPARQSQKPTRAFEEFVECYTRKLNSEEKPYEVQFFHEPQSGYTRRFELRSCSNEEGDGSKSQDQFVPSTPLFGSTSHDINNRRSRSKSQDTFDFSIEEDTSDEVMVDGRMKQSPGFLHSLVDCSSPDSMDILTPLQPCLPCCSFYPSITSGVFLLNLQLVPIKQEFLIYSLLYEQFIVRNKNRKDDLQANNLQNQVEVCIDACDSKPGVVLCTIKRDKQSVYSIDPVNCNLSINGETVSKVVKLCHGDLIKIGNTHLFMFQNHSTSIDTHNYQWIPKHANRPDALRELPDQRHTQLPSSQTVHETTSSVNTTVIDEVQKPLSTTAQVVYITSRDEICSLPTLQEVEGGGEQVNEQHVPRRRSSSDVSGGQRRYSKSRSNQRQQQHKQHLQTSGQRSRANNKLGAFPADRRLMFSYNMAEEDTILELLIDDLNPTSVIFSLAPSYALSMCMEYSMRCSGPDTASRLACKAVEKIQKKVDKVIDQVSSWQPQTSETVLYPSLDKIYNPLHSILFWLANTLEFYNFLLSQETLDLSLMMQKENAEDDNDDNAMTILENIMQHLFQQAFYPVSKILYVVLPRMLEEGEVDRSSCVYFVVDFLKTILELMFELHIHTEMVAQFFANIFFFLNGAMFNALIDQGPKLGLFEYVIGKQLRTKLDVLENWAGREGFRDGPLQFFAVFSSAVDLIATPPEELLLLTWPVFREEFPALLPSQLHYILAHYLLPENQESPPVQWTPVPETEASMLTKDSLHESFESHPQFEIPIGGFLLDLDSGQSCDNHMLHEFVDSLRKDLKKKQKSVNIVGIKKSSTTTPAVPTVVYSTNTYPLAKRKKPLLNIKEIVTSDLATTSHQKSTQNRSAQNKEGITEGKMRSQSSAELRGRVKSTVEPYIVAPEKLVILLEKSGSEIEWYDGILENESRNIVTVGSNIRTFCLQRGNRGFGFTTEIRRDPITGFSKLFVHRLIPDSGIEDAIDITPGDQILAVDDLEMSCQEFQQYIKDAEEEITLTVCSSPDHQAFTQ